MGWQKFTLKPKSISSVEMDEKQHKSLCFHYNEKQNSAHVCKRPTLCFISGVEKEQEFDTKELEEDDVEQESNATQLLRKVEPEIFIHAMAGTPTPNTIRLLVEIWWTSRATHNFLESLVMCHLRLRALIFSLHFTY